jgi:lipase ATG15
MNYVLKYSLGAYSLLVSNSSNNYNYNSQLPISHYENVMTLAKMSYDAYIVPGGSGWKEIPYNYTNLGGSPAVEGYVFTNENDIIVSIKGTSIWWYNNKTEPDNQPWTHQEDVNRQDVKYDRFNDNLLLSCCYYRQSRIYKDMCNYKNNSYHICEKQCYTKSSLFKMNYLNIAKNLVDSLISNNVIDPKKRLIFTGHSLGGVLATYLGIVYNKPVVTFESPGEKYYFDLIDLKYTPEIAKNIYHYGHTADIIFTGRCNGLISLCYLGGYVIRTKCHIGNVCSYDSITKMGLSESLLNHRLDFTIKKVIPMWKDDPPICKQQTNCSDCDQWSFI